jgi:transcriptional regulator with PAS, ATPase and Fis domain
MLRLNPAFRRVSGIPHKLAVGHKVMELLEDGTLSDSSIARVVDTAKTTTIKLITAAKRQVLSTARPILDDTGSMVGIVCNLRNLTVLHKADHTKHGTNLSGPSEHQGFIANSPKMLDVLELATDLAQLNCNALILGETGVGKGVIAHYIYEKSARALTGSFIKVNCAAIPASLFESELFGYDRGAFTGALDTGKPGLVEMADGGVLFLDEIGDLPLEQQAKLLGVIEDGLVIRVGGTSHRKVDVRIIAATNQDLGELVSQGRFRQDLYYRIAVIPLYVPPLRERHEDIKGLLLHFEQFFSEKHSRKRALSPQLRDSLCRYSWPGNVRELANLVECLVVTGKEEVLNEGDLSRSFSLSARASTPEKPFFACSESESLKDLLANYELELVKRAIESTLSYAEAARLLKTSLSTINRHVRRLKKLGGAVGEFVLALQGLLTIVSA